MSLEINITDNFDEIVQAFDKIEKRLVGQAARYAINRTLLTLRGEALKEITKQFKIKEKTLRQKHISITKARGGDLSTVNGMISFSGQPIPLIEFVRGNKTPQSQKGIPIKRRRKIRVEITPGKRFEVKRAFIQTVHSTQLFKRAKSGGFKKQGIRSIAYLIRERGLGQKLVAVGKERFRELFLRDLEARMKGLVPKA